jgi:hypothetical protein
LNLVPAELTVIFIGWLTYVLFGAVAVSSLYDRSLIGAQAGVPRPPVTHYVEQADRLILSYLAAGLLLIALQLLLSKMWRATRRSGPRQSASSNARLSSGRIYLLRLLTSAFGCLVAVGILILSNRVFVHRLPIREKLESFNQLRFPNLNEAQIMNLGWAHRAEQRPESSYLNYSMEKRPGTYRIGCFGDSFTEGFETASGHDYPSFLQEQLQATDGRKFEVINFGVEGYGMQQAFLMYEYLGRRYHLDAAIFMPFKFHEGRDNTFIYSSVGALHARYVIDGDAFRLVTIDEKTRREALQNYYSLLPPAKYWKYDAQAPTLFSTFAAWRQAPGFNPFYYAIWGRYRSELLQLYSMLFGKAAKEIGKVMVVANDDAIESVANYKKPGVTVQTSRLVASSFLLRAPGGHLSALGNQLRAAEISRWITGHKFHQHQIPVVSDSEYRPAGDEDILSRTSFAVASEGWIEIDGQPVAGFFQHNADEPTFKKTRKVDFRQQDIRGIIQLQSGEEPVFIPVDFPVQQGSPLTVRLSSRGTVHTVPIGTVDCIARFLCRARFRPGSELQHMQMKHDRHDFKFVDERHASVRTGYFDGMELMLSDRLLLHGSRQHQLTDLMRRLVLIRSPEMFVNQFELKPVTADYVYLRAAAGHYVNLERIPTHGSIEIRLRQRDGTVLRLGSYLQYGFVDRNPL